MLAPLSRLLLDLHPALLLLLLLDFLLRSSCCTAGAPRARSRGTCAATTHGDSRQATAAAQTGCEYVHARRKPNEPNPPAPLPRYVYMTMTMMRPGLSLPT